MADVKISGLPASTTPLAGTEVLPIVQGGQTRQVSVNNLTTGKAVTVGSLSNAGNLSFTGVGNRITGDFNNATIANRVSFQTSTADSATIVTALPNGTSTISQWRAYNSSDPTNSAWVGIVANGLSQAQLISGISGTGTYLPMTFLTGGSEAMRILTSRGVSIGDTTDPGAGNLRLGTGNLVIGTSGKGIDFSATAGTGTSELLNDYEEGTWTPAFSSTGATFAYSTQSGTYTKIGRFVYAYFILSTSGAATGTLTNALNVTGLPYSAAEYGGFSNTWGDLALVPTGIASTTTILLYQQGTITQLTPTTSGLSASNKYFVGAIVYSV